MVHFVPKWFLMHVYNKISTYFIHYKAQHSFADVSLISGSNYQITNPPSLLFQNRHRLVSFRRGNFDDASQIEAPANFAASRPHCFLCDALQIFCRRLETAQNVSERNTLNFGCLSGEEVILLNVSFVAIFPEKVFDVV